MSRWVITICVVLLGIWIASSVFGWSDERDYSSPLGESRQLNANQLRAGLNDLPFKVKFDPGDRPGVVSGKAIDPRNGVEAGFAFSVGPNPKPVGRQFSKWTPETLYREGNERIILSRYETMPPNVLAWKRDVKLRMMNQIANVTCNLAFNDDCGLGG